MTDAQRIFPIGPHRVELDASGVASLIWHGDVTPEHMRDAMAVLVSCAEGRPLFVLNDLRGLKEFEAGARKAAAKEARTGVVTAVACFGASFHVRVLLSMVIKAIYLFAPSRAGSALVEFFETEAEARAWLAEKRALHAGPR